MHRNCPLLGKKALKNEPAEFAAGNPPTKLGSSCPDETFCWAFPGEMSVLKKNKTKQNKKKTTSLQRWGKNAT
jgi:hypothetical protein